MGALCDDIRRTIHEQHYIHIHIQSNNVNGYNNNMKITIHVLKCT